MLACAHELICLLGEISSFFWMTMDCDSVTINGNMECRRIVVEGAAEGQNQRFRSFTLVSRTDKIGIACCALQSGFK